MENKAILAGKGLNEESEVGQLIMAIRLTINETRRVTDLIHGRISNIGGVPPIESATDTGQDYPPTIVGMLKGHNDTLANINGHLLIVSETLEKLVG